MRNGLRRTDRNVLPVATSLLIVSVVFLIGACRHRIPSGPPDSELFYRQGLEAFSRATPAYREAIGAFRRASSLIPSRCEYRLHLAESLLFLAQEQQLNWEQYVPSLSEADSSIDAIQSNSASGFGAFLRRVRALRLSFDAAQHSAALENANHAIELDPNDAMNWLVLFQLNSDDPRMPINRAKESAPDLALVQNTDGQYRLDRGEYAEAKQAFEHVLQISPLHFRSMTSPGYLASLEFRPESIGLYMKALDISPTFLSAHLVRTR